MIARRLFHAQRLLLLLTTLTLINRVSALTQTYCSSQNTGSDNLQDTYTFQSNGHCHDKCVEDYAFAVVQGKQCWCSNYAPSDQQDTSNCDTTCPGYGYEDCGNSDDDLRVDRCEHIHGGFDFHEDFIHLDVGIIHQLCRRYYLIVKFVKLLGGIELLIVYSDFNPGHSSHRCHRLALIAGGIVFFLMRMRRKQEQTAQDTENGSAGVTPQRNVSTLSRTGLLRSGEKDYTATLPPINTARQSSDPSDAMTPNSERRNSRPLFYDQRLNPQPFMNLDNGSHGSIVSIEDNRDYTRTLNVRNPDPPERQSRDSW
ncbi:hypothetical protein SLS55_002195 [Diplodia seriata]|uniref:WSC domain-containing protein n=1 Tax=Diplodia seriata TaxID=420778 RepID=A0ABR3CRI5_9PEZI